MDTIATDDAAKRHASLIASPIGYWRLLPDYSSSSRIVEYIQ